MDHDDGAILRLVGEIDMATVPRLVDEVTFMDSTGLHAFIASKRLIHNHGWTLELVVSRQMRRVLETVFPEPLFAAGNIGDSSRRARLAFSPTRPCWRGTVAVWRKLTRFSLSMILLVAVACGDGSDSGATDQATTRPSDDTSTTADTTTTMVATTTQDPDVVPTEMIGTWRSESDDPVVGRTCLSLGARNYSINFCGYPGGGGTASVTGDTITFVSSMTGCPEGEGVYRWQIDDEHLTLTELEPPDPCVDRRNMLTVGDFTR